MVIEDSAQFERRIEREPHGIVFVVARWNYPYLTSINTIVPALIAGNTVVMKHAAQTLLDGEHMIRAAKSAGLPDDILQNVYLDHHTTSELIAESTFDFVNFTGCVGGGQAMERAAAGTFVGVGNELGGKDPAYVMEDADLDEAVASLMDGAFYNAGQCCCGIERVYVHHAVYDEFVKRAVVEVEKSHKGWGLGVDTYCVSDWPADLGNPPATLRMQAYHQDQVTAIPASARCIAQSNFVNLPRFGIRVPHSPSKGIPSLRSHMQERSFRIAEARSFKRKSLSQR